MDERVKAGLNLHAVLPNLEDLVQHDPESRALCAGWRIAIQFSVRDGPRANVTFAEGRCKVILGEAPSDVRLFFTGASHLNRMFEGKANPIPLKGFTRLRFLSRDFGKLTARLTHFLRPSDALLADPAYLALNVRLALNTAAFAVPVLAAGDPVGRHMVKHVGTGTLLLKVLPDGPAVHVEFQRDGATAAKAEPSRPMAQLLLKDAATAVRFLGGKLNTLEAIASGDLSIAGRIPMLDHVGHILERIPLYLS